MHLLDFLKTFVVFLVIDILYLGVLRGNDMRKYFARWGGYHDLLWFYGGIAWLLLAFGVEYFAVQPSRSKNEAFIRGALLGLVIYGVYDFTNMATVKGWTLSFVAQDVLWGTVLCGAIAYLRKSYIL